MKEQPLLAEQAIYKISVSLSKIYPSQNEMSTFFKKCVIMSSNEGIREAGEILMTISDDEREWAIQESRYKGRMDYESGLAASHAKGLEEGVEIGEQQGFEKTARGMKAKNLPIEMITEITGLTAEQVEAL